jgi:hypothetical protein
MPRGELAALTEVGAAPVTGRVVPHFPLDGRGKARIGQELTIRQRLFNGRLHP